MRPITKPTIVANSKIIPPVQPITCRLKRITYYRLFFTLCIFNKSIKNPTSTDKYIIIIQQNSQNSKILNT
jgi:hypothetical protein